MASRGFPLNRGGSFSFSQSKLIFNKFEAMSKGEGAFIVTDYPDINKKRGYGWEASREVEVTNGQRLFSCIKLGSLPIDIKARTLGATGAGLTGRVYALDSIDVDLTGIEKTPFYNKHGNKTSQPEMELYVIDVTDLNNGATNLDEWLITKKCGADINARTNSQNQAAGFIDSSFNSDRVFDPNISDKIVLFEILSHDVQFIDAYLDIYEGGLDFSLEEL